MTTLTHSRVALDRRLAVIAASAAVVLSSGIGLAVSQFGDDSVRSAPPAATTTFQGPDPALSKSLQVGPAPASKAPEADPLLRKSMLGR
jgi:hypothetical protein